MHINSWHHSEGLQRSLGSGPDPPGPVSTRFLNASGPIIEKCVFVNSARGISVRPWKAVWNKEHCRCSPSISNLSAPQLAHDHSMHFASLAILYGKDSMVTAGMGSGKTICQMRFMWRWKSPKPSRKHWSLMNGLMSAIQSTFAPRWSIDRWYSESPCQRADRESSWAGWCICHWLLRYSPIQSFRQWWKCEVGTAWCCILSEAYIAPCASTMVLNYDRSHLWMTCTFAAECQWRVFATGSVHFAPAASLNGYWHWKQGRWPVVHTGALAQVTCPSNPCSWACTG